ncbi:MAG TPA: glycosyltransferase [Thermoguttaceae bacterium]|nr:glycosyltransferase [Thermoguttaceae bacterium]
MTEPIKILHVLSRMTRGGAELRTLEIFRHLDRRRFHSHVCALSGRAGELDDEVRSLGGEVHLIRRGLIGFSARFRRFLREHRFDVVHTHVLNYAGFIMRLAAQSGVPIRVALFHSTHDGKASGFARRIYRRLMRSWIDRYATSIQAVSRSAMQSVWGPHWRSDPRCQVIYDGLEPSPFEAETDGEAVRREFGLPGDVPLCVHVGRMARPKNHLRLISIFAEVSKRRPDAALLLVGRGGNEIERDVRRRIDESGIADRVVFCGQRSDVPRLIRAADVLLLPSLWEGLPGVVLEACAAGTPVLASDLPSVREIADQLPHVQYLPLETDDAHWAAAVRELLEEQPSREERRETGRSFKSSAFTIDHCVRRHCRIWQGTAPAASVSPLPLEAAEKVVGHVSNVPRWRHWA